MPTKIDIDALDQLFGYDGDSHSIKGAPSLAGMSAGSAPLAAPNQSAPAPKTPQGAPSLAPDVPSAGAPSLATGPATPDLAKPTRSESNAAGKAEFEAGAPKVSATAGTPEYGEQRQELLDYQKMHPWGSAVSEKPGVWGKIEHGLSRAGNVAGDFLDPAATERIPGSDLNRAEQTKQNQGWIQLGEENKLKEAQAGGWAPLPVTLPNGQTIMVPARNFGTVEAAGIRANTQEDVEGQREGAADTRTKENIQSREKIAGEKPPTPEQDKQFLAGAEQRLDSGTISDEDRAKLAGMQRAQKLTGLGPEITAQIGEPPVPADFHDGKKDSKYIAAANKWGQLAEGLKNAEAGAQGAARGAGYNETRPVQVIDPASGQERYVTAKDAIAAGAAPVAGGAKALSQQAQIADIKNASQKVRDAIAANGNTPFSPEQTAKLTLAMHENDPTVMRNEISNLAASGLTPKQQDLVTWLQQLQERALSLRSIAGMGQGSETTRQAILKALPSITSGNAQMATKQLDAFDNMVSNLEKGVPGVKREDANEPVRPAGVPDNYHFKADGPKGRGWYKP